MPEFTVLLPVFNGEKYLDQSIKSIVDQTCDDWQLLILDHHSQDRSKEIAESYASRDKRIQVQTVSANGLSDLLNIGVRMADGRYLMRHDADDISRPHRMALTKQAFDDNPGIVVVAGQCNIIREDGRSTGQTRYPTSVAGTGAAAFFYNPIAHSAVTFHLARFNELDCSYGSDIIRTLPAQRSLHVRDLVEDYFLFGQLAVLGHCINTPEVLIDYRVHQASVSRQKNLEQRAKSLEVSQYIAESWCRLRGARVFDVKPFTNHGTHLTEDGVSQNYDEQFKVMKGSLTEGLASSIPLLRELDFRYVIADRNKLRMAMRFCRFALQNRPTSFEFRTVTSWLRA